jgi:hypothetical protein
MPMSRARTKRRVEPPPKRTSARRVKMTVIDVLSERTRVWDRE